MSHDKSEALKRAGSHAHKYSPSPTYSERQSGGKSARNYFKGTGTKVEADKKGVRGYYHNTNVAKMDKKGDVHFRTGGYLTNTTVRRMQTFAREHGGMKDIAISRAKGQLTAYKGGKKIAHSGRKGHEHLMTLKHE